MMRHVSPRKQRKMIELHQAITKDYNLTRSSGSGHFGHALNTRAVQDIARKKVSRNACLNKVNYSPLAW
jgi:hypothetical protein